MKKVIAVLIVLVVYAGFAFAAEKARDGRFIAYDDGTVLDTRTNLMWAAKDNGRDIDSGDARSYCEKFRGGGYTDWRMPTPEELKGLYDKSKTYKADCGTDVHLTELIHLTCNVPWTSELGESKASYFHFGTGGLFWISRDLGNPFLRALPVRSAK